ncbi:MAG: T9SS type A sorting domain-containing protein [Bacteroidales bacterium]|nr:T9SS type A sorting domain-containing protein [Bacteroidales bacterium]
MQGEYRLYTSKSVNRPAFLAAIQDQYANEEVAGILFDIYPNPFSGQTAVRLTGEYEYQPHTVEVFSAAGARVRMIAVPAGIGEVTLDGDSLVAGVYYVKVTSGRVSSVKRVVRY